MNFNMVYNVFLHVELFLLLLRVCQNLNLPSAELSALVQTCRVIFCSVSSL